MRKNRMKIQVLVATAIVGAVLSGHWLSSAQTPQSSDAQKAVLGDWQGTLVIGDNRLRLVLKVADAGAGQVKATMDSLDQNANNLQVDTINFKNGLLHFEMKALSITYDGTLNKEGTEFVGTFKQGPGSFPVIFKKVGIAKTAVTVQRGRVALKPCDNPTLTSDALCGTHEVFEDRVARGRKIALNILLLPATNAKAAPDPLFYFAGGPGGAATTYAGEKFMNGLRRNRDVVLVDQRGTGRSNPLNCPPAGSKQDMRGYFGEVWAVERVRACRMELEKIADLKLYTSSIAMDDVDEVRSALGYERIDLYGGSYGSTAALVYLRQHPQHVRAVAIFGVAPPSAKLPLSFAKGVQDSMNRLFADCAANADCRTPTRILPRSLRKSWRSLMRVRLKSTYRTSTRIKSKGARDARCFRRRHSTVALCS